MQEFKKQLLDFLIKNNGLPKDLSWKDLAEKFNIEPPDKERAKVDSTYREKSPAKVANDIWRTYLRRLQLRTVKQTYVDGELKFETKKLIQEPIGKVDLENFEVTQVTTTPYGNPYIKLKKKEIADKNHLEAFRAILKEEVVPNTKKLKKSPHRAKKALFLYFSDRHIGALTKEESIYNNKYDYEEIIRRNVTDIFNIKAFENLDEYSDIFIMDLGDALDGFNEKTTGGLKGDSTHTLPQQMNNKEQFNTYIDVIKKFFEILVEQVNHQKVYYIATANSNHGGDFDYMAMKTAEMYLNMKYPNIIKAYVTDKFLDHFIYGNHCIIFSHGKDTEDKKKGLPLTLNPTVENYINDYIRVNKLEDYIITFVSGDLHQYAVTYGKNFRYVKVLSQYGGSKWIHTNFGTSRPGITYEIFSKNEENILTGNYYYYIENEGDTGFTL